ncbi:molybdate ABC transporter substrate-binding protein [Thalassovita sp.]|uniref:molybdate ABC transporter substrate-binding protein n=1 Tax=Thalassovita sp. TaxID=1979401 RepID=UPI0039B6F080
MPLFRLLLTILLFLPSPILAGSVTVFAAASLKTALDRIAGDWNARTGHTATVSFAGSSALARQIEAGAPADIFISANPGWMDHLAANALIRNETRIDLLSNTLVLIAPAGTPALPGFGPQTDLGALLGQDRLAMALVQAVPAGIYGKAALETLGLWPSVADKVAQADNVSAALMLVALGEAPLGIVYGSDARSDPRVTVVADFPADSHPQILYPAAITTDSTSPQAAEFLDFLQSPAASDIFLAAGFTLPEPE